MRRTFPATVAAIALLATLAAAQPLHAASHASQASLESRLAAQGALLDEQYESDLKAQPENATEYGDYRYNDRLNDRSLAGAKKNHEADVRFLARLMAIDTAGFGEQQRLSHQVMQRMLQQRIDNYRFKEFEMPVNQMDGVHVELADLPLAVPLDSVQRYEDYIARLHEIPRTLEQTKEVLRAGMKDHLVPVRFLLEQIPAQCEGIIAADPFLQPAAKFPDSIGAADRERLSKAINEAAAKEVLPAYKDFGHFIATEYAPKGRTSLSVSTLPGGAARYINNIRSYTTVTNMTPAQIHALGLREIDRIEAEMLAIARAQGFADLEGFRKSLHANPKYVPVSSQQIVDDYAHYIAQMRPKLPEMFGLLPNAPVTVEAMPPFQSADATHYNQGTPDGKRAGRVVVATADFAERTLIDDESIAYHEGIPGHHLQISIAQQLTDLPQFRRHVSNSGYVEGWALYAEQLGKEVGFYQDPGSDFGRLSSDLFRAVRLVVDTGIHSMGWSREQVVEFFRKAQAVDEPTIQSETDRYIAIPGQALAYKLGQLKIRELRERARTELGPKFDIRAFHDEILNAGVLPLDLLETRTDEWIASQKLQAR
jgi:uncharacterized protein (DUF885 family)